MNDMGFKFYHIYYIVHKKIYIVLLICNTIRSRTKKSWWIENKGGR
jgi:hypothetical protein